MLLRYPSNDSSKLHQYLSRLMYELICSFKCLKLYSLKFAIAHAQIKIVMLIKIGLNCVALNTRKLLKETKSATMSIFDFFIFFLNHL